ncbi:hypothetical protein F5884DRAFT_247047 [Xylogone sp. PMI_703]|nr:hypothetical protein F5884DRAFT_247047 [Xylogone sp. PMI_703]
MAPIRVGMVGLSAMEPALGPGSWGVAAHLKSIQASPKYELVAVCNSTAESARRSIEYHKLPTSVKAYGNVEDLANDPNVDLVVVSIMVQKHLGAALPALHAKKHVFVEWPLGATTKEAEQMEELAQQYNLKTFTGLQFRADPSIAKVKQLIESGAIGRIMSTQVMLCPTLLALDQWIAGVEFFLDYNSGGNEYHIGFAHFMDTFLYLLGDFDEIKPIMSTQIPIMKSIDTATGKVVNPSVKKTAPDHVFITGMLKSGAIASINLRKAQKPIDEHSLRWIITGDEGELELTITGKTVQMGSHPRKIRLTQGFGGETKEVDWKDKDEPAYIEEVLAPGTNTARIYEAFADNTSRYADMAAGVRVHQLLDRIAVTAKWPYHKQ